MFLQRYASNLKTSSLVLMQKSHSSKHHRRRSNLERRLHDRSEERRMVDRDVLGKRPLPHGFIPQLRIRAPNQPKRTRLPNRRSQHRKVLAPVDALLVAVERLFEELLEGPGEDVRHALVVEGHRKTRRRLDERRLRRAARVALGLHDAPDGGQDPLPRLLADGPHVDSQLCCIRNDVFRVAGLQAADGHDGHFLRRVDLAADDRLQAEDDGGGHDGGVDGPVRHGGVPAAPVERDLEAVAGGHHDARSVAEAPRAVGEHMLAEHAVGERDLVVEAVVDHGLRAAAALFVGLEDEDQGPAPEGGRLGHLLRCG